MKNPAIIYVATLNHIIDVPRCSPVLCFTGQGIRSLAVYWLVHFSDTADPSQTVRMRRLILVYAGRLDFKPLLSWHVIKSVSRRLGKLKILDSHFDLGLNILL